MVNGIRTIYPSVLNKWFSLRYCVGFWVWHETPEKDRGTYQPKHCEYNNEDKDNSPNILSDKNYKTSSQKFRQINIFILIL